MKPIRSALVGVTCLALAACGAGDRLASVGKPPDMSTIGETGSNARPILSAERAAMAVPPPEPARFAYQQGSLWNTGQRGGLLSDNRARTRGDILTIVIEIDDEAEMKNTSERSRAGSENMSVSALFGLNTVVEDVLPNGATLDPAVDLGSRSASRGSGSTKRNEKLTLRLAATVVEVLPNGHLVIQGDQEVRVNFELRDLQITGIVRPEDISRRNEVAYDRIAGARIAYGGRGQITDVQQPRYGQQVTDILLPY
jgi:flagellar L-ring protein precursor FlgH